MIIWIFFATRTFSVFLPEFEKGKVWVLKEGRCITEGPQKGQVHHRRPTKRAGVSPKAHKKGRITEGPQKGQVHHRRPTKRAGASPEAHKKGSKMGNFASCQIKTEDITHLRQFI
jgi:hypothetical protein